MRPSGAVDRLEPHPVGVRMQGGEKHQCFRCLREITHLILISDLRMLYPTWRIFYQFGESHLNVFWHHILENLLSVDIFYQIGIMFYQMFTISEGSIFFVESGIDANSCNNSNIYNFTQPQHLSSVVSRSTRISGPVDQNIPTN